MSDRMMDRVAKLLRKAESTTPEEAEALTAAAEKLIVKHGIDRAKLDALNASDGKLKIEIIKIPFEGMWQTAHVEGFMWVVEALGLKSLQSKTWDGKTMLWIVGPTADIQDASDLVHSLRNQSEVALKAWWKVKLPENRWMSNHQRHVEKRSFMEYFGVGAARRIREERQNATVEAGTGTDLVLAGRRAQIDEWVGENLYVGKGRKRRDAEGYMGQRGGFTAGQNASLSRGVEGSSHRALGA